MIGATRRFALWIALAALTPQGDPASAGAARASLAADARTVCAMALEVSATETIMAVYRDFVAAQNARDIEAVGAFFIDGPEFLWVSDGRPYWGREATLERMALFQGAEIWRVIPDLENARAVMLGAEVAMLHFDLILEIGSAVSPSRLPFRVSILFVDRGAHRGGWRIASLITTEDKQPSH